MDDAIYLFGVSRYKSVDEQPEVELHDWSIVRGTDGPHFIGSRHGMNGRCSTPIVAFDESLMHGKTASGRVYHLVGPKNEDRSNVCAELVWSQYQQANNVQEVPWEATH